MRELHVYVRHRQQEKQRKKPESQKSRSKNVGPKRMETGNVYILLLLGGEG
jgi:hypothetical protein